jgi:diguanylate cyclase (GGDEF)-like protein/PAS domain S-box-containing protein
MTATTLAPLIDLLADWHWEQDAALRFTAWTAGPGAPVAIEALGRTRCEQDPLRDCAQETWDEHQALLQEQLPFRGFVSRMASAEGELRYVSASGLPVHDEHGRFAGYRGIATDVTERARSDLRRTIELEVTRLLATHDNLAEASRRTMQVICHHLAWDCGGYWAREPKSGALRCEQTWGESPAALEFLAATRQIGAVSDDGRGIVRAACAQAGPVWIRDVGKAPGFLRAEVAAHCGLHSAFAFPVKVDGQVVGVMEFFSRHVHQPDTELLQWAGFIAEQLARFIQLADARQRLEHSEDRLRSLIELSSDWVWEQDEQFRFTALTGSKRTVKRMKQRGWTTSSAQIGKTRWDAPALNLREEDWVRHRAVLDRREAFYDFVIRRPDLLDGKPFWISVSGMPYYDAEGNFKGYRGMNRDISERKLSEERIEYLATHDPLTGLPNRALFAELLDNAVLTARRYERQFAVFFIDLDRFKLINDSLGHATGDTLLREVSQRLAASVRASDVVARLGGDEFVVLVQEVGSQADVEVVANNMLAAIFRPVTLLGQECRVSGSIGICLFPGQAADGPTLMKNADSAMYLAKEEGKNQYRFYSEERQPQSLERMALETSLRHAIERNELFLHYQAKQDLKTRRVCGVEALLRWQHPELGVVPPLKFIPLAEETGLIIPIGKWVLNTACMQNVAWQKAGFDPMCMAINLSARQFGDDFLLDDIRAALDTSGMAPELLELELTESMVIQHPERAIKLLKAIKQMGVRVAIDDFGTGYSSLTQLKNFPIDTLKVDRSFIRDLHSNKEDRAMTKAIIAMGKTLGLTVVAEGVETEEQQSFLGDNACDQIQGFYFSKPLAPEQLHAFLSTQLVEASARA